MNTRFVQQAERYLQWIKDDALPLWASTGIDATTGASVERLLANGDVDRQADVRVRVQARQLYVFCVAHQHAWYDATSVVQGIADFVARHGRHPSGSGYAHLLRVDGELRDARQDLYDHAFHLLANAWRFRVFGDEAALADAEKIMQFLDERFASVGGWLEGDYDFEHRRQNPHMHLFEAFLALYEATGHSHWLARAGEMFALFETRFLDAQNTVILEYFDRSWERLADAPGRVVEPGHLLEWVWLLRKYGGHARRDVSQYADPLYENALRMGLTKNGLLVDEVSPDGSIVKGGQRCWPMTELIKASCAQARAGRDGCLEQAADAVESLMRHFLQATTRGAYIDRIDAQGRVSDDTAPASSLYHLVAAAAELALSLDDGTAA